MSVCGCMLGRGGDVRDVRVVEREGPEGRLKEREWLDPGHGDRQSPRRRVTES
jgi:hypothetical protein